jgi:PAS domain S-box-containing protein
MAPMVNEQNKVTLELLEELARERNQLRTLIDHLPDYIYFKDTKSRFLDANKATVRIMKCKTRDDLLGKTDFDFYPKNFAQKYFADECDIIKTGEAKVDIEESIIDEQGRHRFLSTSKVPLRNKTGKIIGLVGIGRDITERKHVEDILKRDNETFERIIQERSKKLLEVQAEFEQAKRLSDVGALAATVAHELRNPLGIIQMAIRALRKDKALDENKYIKAIDQNSIEGHRIIDNLLNYSRIKVPSYESVDLAAMIDQCIGEFQLRFEGQNIKVTNDFDPDIKMVDIDRIQIKEVIVNIMNNAGQALPPQGGEINISVRKDGNWVNIAIKDNGVGIAKEDLDKIFMPFFTSKTKGTGLGLPLCNELVSLHRGKIEVDSRKGEGTTFLVILPIKH